MESSVAQAIRSLRGFKRIFFEPGESKTIEIPLAIEDMGYYDEDAGGFVVEPGIFEIQVGAYSSDIRLKTEIEVR